MSGKKIRRTHKRTEMGFLFGSLLALFVGMMITRGFTVFEHTGENIYHIYLNGIAVGDVDDPELAEDLLLQARRNIAGQSSGLLFMSGELTVEGEEVLYGEADDEKTIIAAMEQILGETISSTIQRTCTVKIEEYMVNLNNMNEARDLLQAAIDLYDEEGVFVVELQNSSERDFNVVVPVVVNTKTGEEVEITVKHNSVFPEGGIATTIADLGINTEVPAEEMDFGDFELGVISMDFVEDVEISEGYLPKSQVTPLADAIEYLTKEQEVATEYEVKAGDTLSGISLKVSIPMETLVSMNSDKLASVNSTLSIGQKLIITVPEPEISIERLERIYVEEVYDAPVIYVDNDNWYTTQSQVLQQPSSGFRRAVVDIHYVNAKEKSRDILKEEVLLEAVPKIVERGTKIPPTYVKPISGGRITSYFGRRVSPGGIGSTNHQGVDWYVPLGTPVYASCGGTVSYSGWGSGYGYTITINHPDGRQTRYAHCSKLVVSAGTYVNQGDLIAYSGSTGNSTGPHLHFEMIIGGVRVNPLDYI